MERRFTPLVDAYTSRIRADIDLPFDVEERVGLDLPQTESLMQIGGIRTLRIDHSPETDTSQASAVVAGTNAFGEAVAGKATMNYVPTHDYSISGDSAPRLKQRRWIDLDVRLNTEEIKQRFLHHDQDIRQSTLWAKELNSIVKKTVVMAGCKHLLSIGNSADHLAFLVMMGLDTYSGVRKAVKDAALYPQDSFAAALFSRLLLEYVITGIGFNLAYTIFGEGEKPGEGRRNSLFYGIEADRALALGVLGLTSRLAAPMET